MLFGAIVAAVLSNLIDRVFYGGVIDYISVFGLNTFNLADLAIVSSMIIIFINIIIKKEV